MHDLSLSHPATDSSRRRFIVQAGGGLLAGLATVNSAPAATGKQDADLPPASSAADTGKPVELPPFIAKTERQNGPPPTPLPQDKRVGFAVVGLGRLAVEQILPAFAESRRAKLVAVVSGTPEKADTIARQYDLPAKNVYSYETFDHLRDNPEVQVVYVVLPNSMHEEFVTRAARAGKHVLCEKPMATNPQECERMIAACKAADRKLMIAYRIQYEPYNRMLQKMVREKTYGKVAQIESVNVQVQGDPNQWRQKLALAGGGALPDVGLYCLNTTRFLLGEEPLEVSAGLEQNRRDPRFAEVEDSIIFQMRFPSGALASAVTGYDSHESRRYRVYAETGWFGLDPAFSYRGLRAETSHAEGQVELRCQPNLMEKNQFALELDHMAECVQQDRTPYTPGEEGLQDHRIMAAIYESARERKWIKLPGSAADAGKLDLYRGEPPNGSIQN